MSGEWFSGRSSNVSQFCAQPTSIPGSVLQVLGSSYILRATDCVGVIWQCHPMARAIDKVGDINDEKHLWKIAVRVTDIWTVFNKKTGQEHLEMIFMDERGHKIQALVPKEDMQTWKTKLKEQHTYVFENFFVFQNDFLFKVADHPCKLIFSGGTIFTEKELLAIPPTPYNFKNFAEINGGNFRPDLLVDLIGLIHEITFKQPDADPKKIVFTMKDTSSTLLNCTLWDSTANKLMSYVNENGVSRPIIIILTHAKLKAAQGKYPPSVSNAWHGSKLLINEDVPEIIQFKQSFPQNELLETSSTMMSQITASSQFSDVDRFMYKAMVKSIQQINALSEDTTCVTVGTTGIIIPSKNGWSYLGCAGCSRRATSDDSPFTCISGHYTESAVPRYKVEIRVFHNKHSSKFIFWDTDCARLIGKTALQLRKQMSEEGEHNPLAYPRALDDLLARTMAYRIRVQTSNNQSSVMKASDDPQTIQTILDHIEPQEHSSKLEKAKSVVNEEVQFDTQSLSATAENDPDLPASITPAKRISTEIQSDDCLSQELATAQLSSTKIAKNIKTE